MPFVSKKVSWNWHFTFRVAIFVRMLNRLGPMLSGKCPKCEQGKVFSDNGNIFLIRAPKMYERCENCNHKFEKEPGYFFGAMYINYALLVGEAIIIFVLAQPFFEDAFDITITWIVIIFMLLTAFVNIRFSRLLWMYLLDKKIK